MSLVDVDVVDACNDACNDVRACNDAVCDVVYGACGHVVRLRING